MIRQEVFIGNAKLILADCSAAMPSIEPVCAIVTDPPYEFKSEGRGVFREKRQYMNEIRDSGLSDGFDHNLLHNGRAGSVFCFCHNDQLLKLLHHFQYQFRRVAVCQWHKTNPMPVRNKHYLPDTEFYIHAWNEGFHPIGEHQDMSRYFISAAGTNNFGHPTEKPIDLMNKIIRNVNGQSILDPFMGTGTTGVAAIQNGKSFIGIEKDQKWFDIACERIHLAWKAKEEAA